MEYDYKNLIDEMYDAVYFVDKDRRIIYWNKAAEEITGYSASEVIGTRCADNVLVHVDESGANLCKGDCPLAKTIQDEVSREASVYLQHKAGHRLPVVVRVAPLRDGKGVLVGGAELFTDNSEKSLMLERIKDLEEMALLDGLTKLSNRSRMEFELEARMEELKRYGLSFGVLFIDIDHFKRFNETYGHDKGDLALKTVANTLQSASRPFDIYGRWGGEEFVGIIKNVDYPGLSRVGRRCLVLVQNSFIPLEEERVHVTVSIGGTLAKPTDTVDSVIKRAEGLMYDSKKQGRNRLILDSLYAFK